MARLLPPERDIGVPQAPVRACLALTGMFVLVLLAVALLSRIGIDPGAALAGVVGAALALFVLAALMSHSRRAADFYVADRRITGAFGGLASAAMLAGLLVIGIIGGAYASHTEVLVAAAGFAAGYLILAILIAPGLRNFGAHTAGDFMATRFGGVSARLLWAAIAFSASFLVFLADLKIAGPLLETVIHVTPEHALYAAAGLTLVATLPGGMRSLTWTQAIQYFVIALACLVPIAFLAFEATESTMPQDFGALLASNIPPLASLTTTQSLLAAIGTASLPPLLARALTTRSRLHAATSMAWSVLFSAVLVLAGLSLAEILAKASAVQVPASGDIAGFAAILASLPAALAGLVVAGTLAALFALGQAALFSAATALSHDVYDEILDRRGPEGRRIFVARVILIGVAAGGAHLAIAWHAETFVLVPWALALGAAGIFSPLVLGLWWRRCNEIGAAGGMVAGFGFTGLIFLIGQKIVPTAMVASDWADVGAAGAGMAGLVASAMVTIGLSLVTPAPEDGATDLANGGPAERNPQAIRERPA